MFEIRDAGTFIVVMATRIGIGGGNGGRERALVRAGGWEPTTILVTRLDSTLGTNSDPFAWNPNGVVRTMKVAHDYIIEHWDRLESGDLICVETIIGERDDPKATDLAISGGRYNRHPK